MVSNNVREGINISSVETFFCHWVHHAHTYLYQSEQVQRQRSSASIIDRLKL